MNSQLCLNIISGMNPVATNIILWAKEMLLLLAITFNNVFHRWVNFFNQRSSSFLETLSSFCFCSVTFLPWLGATFCSFNQQLQTTSGNAETVLRGQWQ
ncbi:uncharacterized protein LOC119981006 isoform X2 [Tripterygium wilfordii]|uniref:uncharacterized protein LOC119981006 isoform X2 n=1 Tax=Tripterygium wilfordii TaxID=458696 RepID=UPI0018F807A7|nr:uncharacterized protein LOC119981006 isoform X2 [Tripterygium wilfordii]